MTYTPRPYSEIKAARQASILAGAPLIPKCHCFYCDLAVPAKALYCSTVCAQDYAQEVKELRG